MFPIAAGVFGLSTCHPRRWGGHHLQWVRCRLSGRRSPAGLCRNGT